MREDEVIPGVSVEPLQRLARDVKKAAAGTTTVRPLSITEARYLVDLYYTMQEHRIAVEGQVRAMGETDEPHLAISWFGMQTDALEKQVAGVLDAFSASQPLGVWARSVVGIGPVIAAGLLAHIDLTKAPTVGHIWRFAGLDPNTKWLGREKAAAAVREALEAGNSIEAAAERIARANGLNAASLVARASTGKDGEAKKPTAATLTAAVARLPWNASLKVLCWKIGESFVKVQAHEDDVYGKVYTKRKAEEIMKNEAGLYAEQAKAALEAKRWRDDTTAKACYLAGKLPQARIHARAKRYAVKLFLAHYHEVGRKQLGLPVPLPYPIAFLNHVHKVEPPDGGEGGAPAKP